LIPLIQQSDDLKQKIKIVHHKSQLELLSTIYPWHPSIYHEICIDSDRLGDKTDALDNIRAALQLDPSTHVFWRSMRTVCSKYGSSNDARFSGIMESIMSSRGSEEHMQISEETIPRSGSE
jgi:hypothetical protein